MMNKQALLEETYNSAFDDELEKVGAAKWVSYFNKLLKLKKFRQAENMATKLTTGRVFEGRMPLYEGHISNLRATIGSGSFKDRSSKGISNMTRRAVKESKKIQPIGLKDRLSLYKEQKSNILLAKEHGDGKPYSKLLKEEGNNPKRDVHILHGSTDKNVGSFLSGKSKGTEIYSKNKGLWVHVNPTKKILEQNKKSLNHNLYRNFHTLEFGGRPVTLTGKIQPKKLISTPFRGEAGLTSANIKNIKNLRVNRKPSSRKELFEAIPENAISLKESVSPFKWGGKKIRKVYNE